MIGKTLGHYQISSQLGKGGMGEVFQAKDQVLGREVAIKVLPEEFARDADRVARFQREAKVLASLNHPSIATIHGLEESGGTSFLVLELVEGQTLADRIKAGPISVEEALKLGLQIAEALEAAHEKGIIHRDLKPSNIKVTSEGKVKVLDFGLAKAYSGEKQDGNLSNSPTLSDAATQRGVILGTAAYMSPEQAKGKGIDKRADIWAFGVVLFEMITGRQLFKGETVSETLAAVLMREPDFRLLPHNIHPRLRFLIERCLEKEPKNRYHEIADVRVEIQKVLGDPAGVLVESTAAAKPRKMLQLGLPWVAAIAVLCLAIAGVAVYKLKPSEPRKVMRFDYELPEGQQFTGSLAVSPDGTQFVYSTANGLYLRSVDALAARLIAGTDRNSMGPVFSPDSKWLAYWSSNDRKLKKIAISGGAPVVVCDTDAVLSGLSWGSDNNILYSEPLAGGVRRISADGGSPDSLVKADVVNPQAGGMPIAPQMLPDGKTLLFTKGSVNPNAARQIVVQSLDSGKQKVLCQGNEGIYLASGHLIYRLATSIVAVPFDLDKLEIKGGPVPVIERVRAFDVSEAGTMVYISRLGSTTAGATGRTLVWVDRNGKEEAIAASPNTYAHPSISPDGTKVALSDNKYIWIWDIRRSVLTRLTFKGTDFTPVWTPDGKRIAFGSIRREGNKNASGIYWKAADGTGEEEQLGSYNGYIFPYCWSSDGTTLIGAESPDGMKFDIWMMSLDRGRVIKPVLSETYLETQPRISPDKRWIAYTSNESGTNEVYVRPFPDANKGRWQVSPAGGDTPLWSPNGHELFYFSGDTVMAVSYTTESSFSIVGSPRKLFQGPYACPTKNIGDSISWDISPDGKRFLMIKLPGESTPTAVVPQPKINIVLNWLEELKQRVPVK